MLCSFSMYAHPYERKEQQRSLESVQRLDRECTKIARITKMACAKAQKRGWNQDTECTTIPWMSDAPQLKNYTLQQYTSVLVRRTILLALSEITFITGYFVTSILWQTPRSLALGLIYAFVFPTERETACACGAGIDARD